MTKKLEEIFNLESNAEDTPETLAQKMD